MVLSLHFQKPKGFQFDRITHQSGFVRIGMLIHPKPRALVFITPGLSEFIEKYFETIQALFNMGFSVGILDWRGQGRSMRHENRRDVRLADFEQDVKDLRQAIDHVQGQLPKKLPLILLGHSMGGATSLHLLAKAPDLAACAVLNAPMVGLPVPLWAYDTVSHITHLYSEESVFWGQADNGLQNFIQNQELLTSSAEHAEMVKFWLESEPDLQMGRLTFGWVRQAFAWTQWLHQPANVAQIVTPVLVVKAGLEKVVSNAAIDRYVPLLVRGSCITIQNACHEVMIEKPDLRQVFWQAFTSHVDRYI